MGGCVVAGDWSADALDRTLAPVVAEAGVIPDPSLSVDCRVPRRVRLPRRPSPNTACAPASPKPKAW